MVTFNEAHRDSIANNRNEKPFVTLEVINPAYRDPITDEIQILRVINDNVDLNALLESDAEYNADEIVPFYRCIFQAVPKRGLTYELNIENIGTDILIPLRAAAKSGQKTKVNIRHYLRSTAELGSTGEVERLTASSATHGDDAGSISIKFNILEKLSTKFPAKLHGTK